MQTPIAHPRATDTDLDPLKKAISELSLNDRMFLIEWMKREGILGFRAEASKIESAPLDSRKVS